MLNSLEIRLRYKKTNLFLYLGCSCGAGWCKILTPSDLAFYAGEMFDERDEGYYGCPNCKTTVRAIERIDLRNKYIHCEHCKKNTQQTLESYNSKVIQTRCSKCNKINQTDLTKVYCESCKDYTHFKLDNTFIDGEYIYDVYKCTKCAKEKIEVKDILPF